MPKKPPPPSQTDIDAFKKAVEGTKPLSQNKIRLAIKPIKTTTPMPKKVAHKIDLHLAESDGLSNVQGEEIITYKHDSISNKILRKLRKGQYNVEAVLDLHGMSVDKANAAVKQFLQQCLQKEIRVALIIHGKGHHSHMPILKNKLNRWLRNLDVVLAFCSAAPEHGSRGATYVLLKRLTEENWLE